MKLRYYNIAAVVLLLFSITFTGHSQGKIQNQIDVKNNQLQISKGNVLIDWNIAFNGVEVSSNNQLVVTPVIRAANGQKRELSSIIINGKKRSNLYKRSLLLQGLKQEPDAHSVLKANNKNVVATIPYKATIPYEAWMKNASVYLIEDLCGCAGSKPDHAEIRIADRIGMAASVNFNNYTPTANFITPSREEKKERSEIGAAYLIFEQAKWNILPDLFNNRTELGKIERSLNYIKEEPTAIITGISIKAYASPEGTYEDNMKLSKERAKSLLDYIRQQHAMPAHIQVFSEGYGEDWDRLITLIEADPKVGNREEIVKIIRTVDIFDGREKQIMDIAGGKPYLYMLDKLFPLLRRSDYQIAYTVPAFSLEKGKQLLQTKPGMLSLEEMYLIANTYPMGSRNFNEVFETAVKLYPKDKIANLNAAAAAILDKNYTSAKKFLEPYSNEPEAWNNLAVVYMSELQLPEAENYLRKALAQGIQEARVNLEILAELKEAMQKEEEENAMYSY
jgi:outer membrane protein OmpA-like peptidoglycan-associated protein